MNQSECGMRSAGLRLLRSEAASNAVRRRYSKPACKAQKLTSAVQGFATGSLEIGAKRQ
jgi:hypothetical protein